MLSVSQYVALVVNETSTASSILLTLAIIVLVTLTVRRLFSRRGQNLPPGPWGIPLFGYYPFLGKRPHETLAKLTKQYGGVFSIKLGSKNCVVLGGIESLREAYAKDAFHGRPPDSPFKLTSSSNIQSLIQFDGKPWTDQRRFSLTVLRDLGFGKTRMEDVIKTEVHTMLEEYHNSKWTPDVFHELITLSTVNIIGVLLFGRQFTYDDDERKILDRYLHEISPFHDQMSHQAFFPFTRDVIFSLPFMRYKQAKSIVQKISDFTWKEISQHESTIDPNYPRDYIDSYIMEMKKPGTDQNTFSKNVLNGNVALFLRAGSLTTRATVEWSMLASALYPDIQAKVHAEIDKVVGRDRSVNWSDHNNMPYTMAVLNETQRWRTIVPINILRFTNKDTSVQGYRIPADTVVITNLYGIHNDEKQWPEPEIFKPERMLNAAGTDLIKSDAFVSFSFGRRACPGQSLANMEMFLYYAMILQHHQICFPDGESPPNSEDLKGVFHVTCHPKNLRLVLKARC